MIHEIPSFLSSHECLHIIGLAEKMAVGSDLMKSLPFHLIADGHDVFRRIRDFISEKTNLPAQNQEEFLITRYMEGGEYADHFDSFTVRNDLVHTDEFFQCCMSNGGQRLYTFVFYLNDDFEGGETYFPRLERTIKPLAGGVAYWSNVDSHGATNELMMHRGCVVKSMKKWILVIYVRENCIPKFERCQG